MLCEALWINVHLAAMTDTEPYGAVRDAALAVSDGKISWLGNRDDLPRGLLERSGKVFDGHGAWLTPGLIDCHTHLVYGGNRAREFEMRLQGASYEQIARQGGGIRSTVEATRAADEETLFRSAARRLKSLTAEGVTTVEVKSGYGLDIETELKILRVARQLGQEFPVTICPTYLGAHALPPEFQGGSDAYIDFICEQALPLIAAQGLATAVDAFCETIAFTPAQTERVFKKALECGLAVKIHAEQLSEQGGASLAARYGALSADHLEHLSEKGVRAMASSKTAAVLLPGAFYFLRDSRVPPVGLLRRFHVPMAIATDCNPGTSPVGSLLLMLNMACTLFRLTPEEALTGVTRNAALALGLSHRVGTLEVGKDADLVMWEISDPAELAYGVAMNPCLQVVRQGVVVKTRVSR